MSGNPAGPRAMPAGERLHLEAFLEGHDDAAAADARVAAAKINELARIGAAVEGIERRFLPGLAAAGVVFVIGLWLLFHPDVLPRIVMLACFAALPVVAAVYVLKVRDRTRADREAAELNRRFLAPLGGLYFPAGDGPACVVTIDYQPPAPETLRDEVVRRHTEATR